MRLIEVQSMSLVTYADESQAPKYGILSHRWGKQEVSYQDMVSGTAEEKEGYGKLTEFCKQCVKDGLSVVWVDTCCIDKSSSAELSEAINSMYRWYQNAAKCYAYLFDYDPDQPDARFSKSEWFRRGWTLQELIAPGIVHFYDRNWSDFGSRQLLCDEIADITGIPRDVLHGEDITNYSVAQRMSWAANRYTTRIEDQAYCLLGLFDISMPMLYGEGEKAFIRLQEEIIKHSADQSIFAWPGIISDYDRAEMYDVTHRRLEGLLATSPAAFQFCGDIQRRQGTVQQQPFSITNLGLSLEVELCPLAMDICEARLPCSVERFGREIPISIFLRQTNRDGQYLRQTFGGTLTRTMPDTNTRSRKVRINVEQGQKSFSSQVCYPEILFYKNPFFDITPVQDNTQGFEARWSMEDDIAHYRAVWDAKSVRLIETGGSHDTEIFVHFGFDFDFNPCVYICDASVEYDKSVPLRQEDESNWSLMRNMSVVRKLSDIRSGILFDGRRGEGLLIWLECLDAAIHVQKKPFMNGMRWTVDIQRVDLSDSRPFSPEDERSSMLKGLVPVNVRKVDDDDQCPICLRILNEPITTGCSHTFCQSCFRWTDVSIFSTLIRYTSLNDDDVSAPQQVSIICPICGTYTDALYDVNPGWVISKNTKHRFPAFGVSTFVVGNTHKDVLIKDSGRHDGTFFVRPSRPEFVAEVRVLLHPNYRQKLIVINKPPFEVRRYAWECFVIQVEIKLKPGHHFLHESTKLDGEDRDTLKVDWTLDFEGNGSQGCIKVIVERTKPDLSKEDQDLNAQVLRLYALRTEAKLRAPKGAEVM